MTSYDPLAGNAPNALLADQGDRRTPVVGTGQATADPAGRRVRHA